MPGQRSNRFAASRCTYHPWRRLRGTVSAFCARYRMLPYKGERLFNKRSHDADDDASMPRPPRSDKRCARPAPSAAAFPEQRHISRRSDEHPASAVSTLLWRLLEQDFDRPYHLLTVPIARINPASFLPSMVASSRNSIMADVINRFPSSCSASATLVA